MAAANWESFQQDDKMVVYSIGMETRMASLLFMVSTAPPASALECTVGVAISANSGPRMAGKARQPVKEDDDGDEYIQGVSGADEDLLERGEPEEKERV